MYKRGNKKGQFYLIAAIIIIILIFGIYSVKNYVTSNAKRTIVYDLEKEFGMEGGRIDDFAMYNNKDQAEFDSLINNWTEMYISSKGQTIDDFIFVYGNSSSLFIRSYNKSNVGNVCLSGQCDVMNYYTITRDTLETSNNFKLNLGNQSYNFKLQPDKNFILIIREGDYVTQSQ